jgi:hypothetical protein
VEELRVDLPLTNANLEALTDEMRVLTQKVEKADFYHHRMAKFKSLQMEHTFIKAPELLMHQSRGHKNKVELWESLKGKVAEILEETFTSHRKDEELYILQIEHY